MKHVKLHQGISVAINASREVARHFSRVGFDLDILFFIFGSSKNYANCKNHIDTSLCACVKELNLPINALSSL